MSGDDFDEDLVPLGAITSAIAAGAPDAAREAAEVLLRAAGRALPCSMDAERGVLGACLLDPRVIPEVLETGLVAAAFHKPAHGLLWATVLDMHVRGDPVDTVTVVEALRASGKLEAAGGAAAVAALEAMLATAAHATTYARIVHEKAQLRAVIAAAQRMTESAFRQDRRAVEVVDRAEREVFAVGQAQGGGLKYANRYAELAEIEATLGIDEPGTLPTGIAALDEILGGGFMPGVLYVVGARTSHGKSAFTHNVAVWLAERHGVIVDYYSMEMSARDLLKRELSMRSGVPLADFRRVSNAQRQAISKAAHDVSDRKVRFVCRGRLTAAEVVSHSRRAITRDGAAVWAVDHMHIMGGVGENKNDGYAEITAQLAAHALDTNTTGILLCQLNRGPEKRDDKRPTGADLRASGGTEENVGTVILLHNYEKAFGPKCKDDKRGVVEVIFDKNRNGPIGSVELGYRGPVFRFGPLQDGARTTLRVPADPRQYDDEDRRAGVDQ